MCIGARYFNTEGLEPNVSQHVHSEKNNRTPMHNYTPLAESDSTDAQTMHGVRLAVACGVHCKHAVGSLKVRGVRIMAGCMHTHFLRRAAMKSISPSRVSRVSRVLGAHYKSAVWGQRSSAKDRVRRVTHQAAKVAHGFGVVPSCTLSMSGSFSFWRPPREWSGRCIRLYTSVHAKHKMLSTEIRSCGVPRIG